MTPNFALSALYALDNLEVMRGMDSESVRLIYADPPFNSKRMYQGMSGTKAQAHRFRDTWSWDDAKEEWLDLLENDYTDLRRLIDVAKAHSGGMGGYLAFMAPRIIEMHRILTPDGSLYLHCDPHADSYLRALLDLCFGAKNFRNAITWQRAAGRAKGSQHADQKLGTDADRILWYSKTDTALFHGIRATLTDAEIAAKFPLTDSRGRYNTSVPLFRQPSMGARPNLCYEYNGVRNPHPSGWRVSRERLAEMDQRGEIIWREGKRPLRKSYASDYDGKPIGDLWTDIPNLTAGKERAGWNTQKPLALLERIIRASSNEGDIVFDPFCGGGTALVAAESLGRRWVGADDDANAIGVVRERVASLKGAVADNHQLQAVVAVFYRSPERTAAEPDAGGVIKDPTGYIIPKMPSDKMSNAAIRELLLVWQSNSAGAILCPGCGELLKARHFHLSNIAPKSTGGSNRIDNRILLCGACHAEKGDGKTLAALWRDHGIGGKPRRDMQERVNAIRDKARAYVQELDSGWRRNDGWVTPE